VPDSLLNDATLRLTDALLSVINVGSAHHIAMLGDVGEPAQGFDVARPHQSSLNSRGHASGRTTVEDLSHSHVGLTVTFWCEGEARETMGHHASTRSTAARMGPGRAATGMPRTKTLGVPATPRAIAHSVTNDGQGR